MQLVLSECDSVAVALSQLEDWQTAAVPLVTLIESLPRYRLDVVEAFLSSTEHGILLSLLLVVVVVVVEVSLLS